MKKYGYWKRVNQRKVIISAAALLGSALMVAILFALPWHADGEKMTDAEKALADMKEISGESRIETLADLKDAQRDEDPEKYLVENSVYVMDKEALDRYVQGFVAGAESTAMAGGVGTEEIIAEWGYESLNAYKKAVKEEAEDFIKRRLAVFEAAGECGVSIGEKEYERLLNAYAARFSYGSREEFIFECTPASIANEMLYDKMLGRIQKGKAV